MNDQEQGPPMICATQIMRPGATRIGRIGGFQLPRTIPIVTAGASLAGALAGIVLAGLFGSGFSSLMYGAIFGGAAGWFLVTYSPLKGESTLKWLELKANAARRGRYINGERVTLAIGYATLPRAPRGRIDLLRRAVNIPSSQYDERGVLISTKSRNLPSGGDMDPLLFAALSLPGESAMSLTPMSDSKPSSRRPAVEKQPRPQLAPRPQRLKD